jgi:outer membrane protein assembly factor BamA
VHRPNLAASGILLIIAGAVLCALAQSPAADADPDTPARISRIDIFGNKHTDARVVRALIAIDSADLFDSAAIAAAKRRLRGSNLFTTADIFPQPRQHGVRLLVVLVERPYFSISDIGGSLYSGKYGYTVDELPGANEGNAVQRLWRSPWRVRLGVAHTNVGGRMERIGVHASLWQWRSLSLSWYKPFIGTPWYVRLASSIGLSPDLNVRRDHFSLAARATVGREIGDRSRIFASLLPVYNSYRWLDSTLTGRDSIAEFYEAFAVIGHGIDRRNARFDTREGWYSALSLSTNWLYPRNRTRGYVQLSGDHRLYHRGLLQSNTVAYRLQSTLRAGEGGQYHALYAGGGEHNLRGYGVGALPRPTVYGDSLYAPDYYADNRLLASIEYRFPILTTPPMDFGALTALHPGLEGFFYRIDGALIGDGAWLWRSLLDALHQEKDLAASLGAGLRIMAPTIKRAVSFDCIWGVVRPPYEWDQIRAYGWKGWLPAWYLYVDMPY